MYASMLPAFHENLPNNATIPGAAPMNPQAVQYLQKALTAGVGLPALGGGAALQVQSLDYTMRSVTATLHDVKLWPLLPKKPSISTVEEYNLLRSYGTQNGIFTLEGELAQLSDATYDRRAAIIKFMAIQKEISHPMLLVKAAHGNVVGLETMNATVHLLHQLERQLFFANSAIIPQAFDGLDAQLFADPEFYGKNTIDLRGRFPTEDDVEQAANLIYESFGRPSHMFMPPAAQSALSKQIYPRERFEMVGPNFDGYLGNVARGFRSSAGDIRFESNIFLRPTQINGSKAPPTAATSPFAPPAPASLSGTAPAGTGSLFTAADAGTYTYWVTAINRFGESAPTQITAGLAFTAGQSSTLTAVSGGGNTTGFRLYRGLVDDTSVANSQFLRDLPSTGTYVDNNLLLPGHTRCYMIQGDINNLWFSMLAPLMKIPLGTVAASIRWMQVLYGTLIVASPRRNVVFLNCPDSNSGRP